MTPDAAATDPAAALDVLALYRQAGAFHEGHFLLASGRHSPRFLQSTTLLQHPQFMEQIGAALAGRVRAAGLSPDFVIGPAMGGVVLAYVLARHLSTPERECRALFAEKDGAGGMKIRGAFTVSPGQTFVAAEDVLTTGGSVMKAVQATTAYGAECLGVAVIVDRRAPQGEQVEASAPLHGLPLVSLTRLHFDTYAPDEVPEWLAAIPLQEI